MEDGIYQGCSVSIHAPVKGRLRLMRLFIITNGSFNPRPREGATKDLDVDIVHTPVSNHAPVKGRPGCMFCMFGVHLVSIHAPVKGRRINTINTNDAIVSFNPRPREGATLLLDVAAALIRVSIHAPVKGRLKSKRVRTKRNGFQSTPP